MVEGNEINNRLEFKEHLLKLPPEERSIEVALMVYDLNEKVCQGNYFSRKQTVTLSSILAGIGAILSFIGMYFTREH